MDDRKVKYKLPEVRVRLKKGTSLYSSRPLNTPESAARCIAELLSGMDREYMVTVNLDTGLCPLNYTIVSIGDVNTAPVPVQNIYKTAILSNASQILLAHNHPSGNLSPSMADFAITKKLYEVSKIMDICLVDHVIIGGLTGDYFSMDENGFLTSIREGASVAELEEAYRLKRAADDITVKRTGETAGVSKAVEQKSAAKKHHRSR